MPRPTRSDSVSSVGGGGLVLVVDDEEAIRELCRVNLELQGFEVAEAGDGVEALEAVRTRRPGVIFLDLMMPRMDGWEVLGRLKEDEATADIPVVLLTARTGDEDQVRGWEGGILEYLVKPFNPQALSEIAEQALRPRDPELEAERRQRVLEQLALVRELRRGDQ
jgi:DNA-binding response OmpR family regulator